MDMVDSLTTNMNKPFGLFCKGKILKGRAAVFFGLWRVLVVLSFLVVASFAQGESTFAYNANYYIADDGKVQLFSDYGKSVYSTWPVPFVFYSNGLDVIPSLKIEKGFHLEWTELDSVKVSTSTSVIVYSKKNGYTGLFMQDFVKEVKEDASVKLYYSILPDSLVKLNLHVANKGTIPLILKELNREMELAGGSVDSMPLAPDFSIAYNAPSGYSLDSLYMYFYVDFDENAYNGSGKDFYAAPSHAALMALDSLRFTMNVSSEKVSLKEVLKKAMKILRDDGRNSLDGITFKLEFFSLSHLRSHSFVFTKDLDNTFYDEGWVDTIYAERNVRNFPRVYRTDACFDGWTIESRSLGGRLFKNTEFNMSLIKYDGEIFVMKPLWIEGDDCTSETVSLKAERGYLKLLQVVSSDTIVRELKSSLEIPRSERGLPFVVLAEGDSAFALEGSISYKGSENKFVENGETIRLGEPAVLGAHFALALDPEPLRIDVASGLEVSGNAVRLRYKTGEMNILRKIMMRIVVEGESGIILDSMLVDSARTTSLEGEWALLPAPVGEYKVTASLYHDRDSTSFVDSLKVASEVTVPANSWVMLSLASVDMKKMDWDADQVIYRWDESYGGAEFYQYRRVKKNDSVDDLEGVWFNTLEGYSLKLKTEKFEEASFAWELENENSGWNLVANPHGYYIDLGTKSAGDSVEFWRWNPQTREYEKPHVLAPYEAVWARVDRHVSWRLSGKPVFDASKWESQNVLARRTLLKPTASESEGWELRVVLSDKNGRRDSWNYVGVSSAPDAWEEPPSAMGDHVSLSIIDGAAALAKSVLQKSNSDVYEWDVELSASNERNGYVSVEGLDALASMGLRVFVTVAGQTSEVSEGDSLKVKLAPVPQKATIRVAKEPRKVVSYALGSLKARFASGMISVEADVGNGLAGGVAKVDVVDIHGNVIASSSFYAKEGLNSTEMRVSNAGIYIVRVKLAGRSLVSKVVAQ